MSNFIFILTEGDHDAAFLYRILKANGVNSYNVLIKEYEKPLNELIKNAFSNVSIEDVRIDMTRPKFLPNYVLKIKNNIFCILQTGGDSQKEKRQNFIGIIKNFNVSDPNEINVIEDSSFSVLFFLDADNIGVDGRISQMKNELSPLFENNTVEKINNDKIVVMGNIKIGLFVFTKFGASNGLLEDILIPLMEKDNEEIFEKADNFLIHKKTNNDVSIRKYPKYSHKKALIGTTGQLQISGRANTVFITDTDYLTDEKIKTDDTCKEIFSFIKNAMTYQDDL